MRLPAEHCVRLAHFSCALSHARRLFIITAFRRVFFRVYTHFLGGSYLFARIALRVVFFFLRRIAYVVPKDICDPRDVAICGAMAAVTFLKIFEAAVTVLMQCNKWQLFLMFIKTCL